MQIRNKDNIESLIEILEEIRNLEASMNDLTPE